MMFKIRSKSLFILGLLMSTPLLQAAVVNGTPLVPRPQTVVPGGAAWIIPGEITVSASSGAQSEIKFVTEAVKRRFTGKQVRSVEDKGMIQLQLRKEDVPDNPEGYTLTVTRSGVQIAAKDVRGIFYGIQTLGNLLLNTRNGRIPGMRITDFPKLSMRETYLQIPGLQKKHLPEIRKMIDLFASFKYNRVLLMLHKSFPYRDLKFKDSSDLTAEDIRSLAAYCRERHIEIVPGLQLLSHVRWLQSHPEYESLLEDPKTAKNWGTNWCPNNPRMRQIWQQAVGDHIELLKPRYFHLHMDEISFGPMATCPRCKNIPQTEWVRAELRRYIKFLEERGVKPIAWHDSFINPAHTSRFSPHRNDLKGWKLLKEFPEGSLIAYWDYGLQLDMPALKYLLAQGKDIYCAAWSRTAGNIPLVARLVASSGKQAKGATLVPFWFGTGTPDKAFRKFGYRAWVGITLGGHCFWNPDAETPELKTLDFDPVYESRRRLFPGLNRRKDLWQSVNINSALNTEFTREWFAPLFTRKQLEQLIRDYASLPEKFAVSGNPAKGTLNALTVSASPTGRDGFSPRPGKVELGKLQTTHLSMLMAIVPTGQFFIDDNEWRMLRSNARPQVGILRIKWIDGKYEDIPLVRALNISNWNAQFPGFEARFPVKSYDRSGRLVQFSMLEWRNSRPQVPVASLEVISAGYRDRALALFAVSAANAKNLPAASVHPAKRFNGNVFKSHEKQRSAWVSNTEVASCKLSWRDVTGQAKCVPVPDPWHPGRQALKITIPPAQSAPFGRVCCDIPVKIPSFAGGFTFRVKSDHPETNCEAAVYLMDRKGNAYMHLYNSTLLTGNVIVPFPLMTKENNPGTHQNMNEIRFSFRQLNSMPVTVIISTPMWLESPFIPINWRKNQGE